MRPSLKSLGVAALVLTFASGCASGAPAAARPRFDAALITREQIQELQVSTAYDVVKTLRGNWLNARGPQSFRYPSAVQLYLDDNHVGDVSVLPSIPTSSIQFIRYYSGQEATAKWGLDHGAGAIYVSTKAKREGTATPPGAGN